MQRVVAAQSRVSPTVTTAVAPSSLVGGVRAGAWSRRPPREKGKGNGAGANGPTRPVLRAIDLTRGYGEDESSVPWTTGCGLTGKFAVPSIPRQQPSPLTHEDGVGNCWNGA
ncbi:hypothetical protein [Streptomyces sp. YKOK-I1]